MNIRPRPAAEETANRILEVAEEHFRRVGYAKTAIADIAGELGMSAANVYRFFPSKSAINEAICRRLLDAGHEMMTAVVEGEGTAAERLERLILGMHAYNERCYTAERRMHDMVEAAMEENWGVIQAHMDFVVHCFARLIEAGVAKGEFAPVADPVVTATMVKHASSCLLHPVLIAERARHGLNSPGQAEALVRFVVNALKT